ncbi:MAG TPA: tetraacyldisaccharide 4'-kinase [Hyphomicrobiaceae bacterium]
MRLDEPAWWYGTDHRLAPRLLQPIGAIWGAVAIRSYARATPYRSRLPVICIGNFTAGGTGKTPLALEVAGELQRQGCKAVFLTRGYGGRVAGPHWVDHAADKAMDVGDEPLLLARQAPTLVSRDRANGAKAIETGERPADVIVMDDGLQNPSLQKDLSLAVVDGRRGLGNGRVIPAGPLRAPLDFQFGLTDAIVVNEPHDGEVGAAPTADWLRRRFPGPVLSASVQPIKSVAWLNNAAVVAFAGTGAPQRFFDLLRRCGADVVHAVPFPDHHPFGEADAQRLMDLASAASATLVTTEKDWARMGASGEQVGRLKAMSRVLPITMSFGERDAVRLKTLLEVAVKAKSGAAS